jgi:sugar (pentulose or hexulose) kinase
MRRGSSRGCEALYLGLDLGTSGCRAVAIDAGGAIRATCASRYRHAGVATDPAAWWEALTRLLAALAARVGGRRVRALAVAGTSGTLLLCDRRGTPLAPAILYDDARARDRSGEIAARCGEAGGALGAGSSLASLLWLRAHGLDRGARHALHPADWIAGKLTGRFGHSDYNNCLKLGYDAVGGAWPPWLDELGVDRSLLPEVHSPGETLGVVRAGLAERLGLARGARVVAGTTDGVASFLAAGACEPGDAVSSLGTTLVLKLLSDRPVYCARHGVYSHRLGTRWLAGGASNSGGGAIAQHFSAAELRRLAPRLDPDRPTGLDYYPLPGTGERFPVSDPALAPRFEPRPRERAVFLQAILEGIARIEARGYALLAELGAPPLRRVYTTGGGARNRPWARIRARVLGVPLARARSVRAAYGAARIAAGEVFADADAHRRSVSCRSHRIAA